MMTTMHQRGFTLVETLVAITVILTAMVGPLYAVQQALNASRSARDQLIASSLAQEGVEFVRGVRDSNYIRNVAMPGSRNWLSGFDGTPGAADSYADCISAPCIIDAKDNEISRSTGYLYLSSAGLYNQSSNGVATPFRRTIQLSAVSGSVTEMTLTVTVTWTTRTVPYTLTITERLHNWL